MMRLSIVLTGAAFALAACDGRNRRWFDTVGHHGRTGWSEHRRPAEGRQDDQLTFTGSQSIAGQQAQCYKVQSIAAGAFSDVSTCYSSSGVPLKTTISSSGSTVTMEATDFSATVADCDFTLPAPVR